MMDYGTAFLMLAASCGCVLFIALLKRRNVFLLWFLVRMVLGTIAIFLVIDALAGQGVPLAVGINPVSLLTSGSLGFSGVALMYAILALKFL